MKKWIVGLLPVMVTCLGVGVVVGQNWTRDYAHRQWYGQQQFFGQVTYGEGVGLTLSDNSTATFGSGSVSSPSITFDGDTDTGVYKNLDGDIAISSDGTLTYLFDVASFRVPAGSAASPSVVHLSDTDTGLYWDGANGLGFTLGAESIGLWKVATGTLTATQVRNLNGTAVEVIAAPGAGLAVAVDSLQLMLDYGTAPYDDDGAGEDFVVAYSGGTQALQACDNATCLDTDATSDQYAWLRGYIGTGHPLEANEAIEISIASGEIASTDDDSDGDSPIHYKLIYRVVSVDLS